MRLDVEESYIIRVLRDNDSNVPERPRTGEQSRVRRLEESRSIEGRS